MKIELKIGNPTYKGMPYESHLESILNSQYKCDENYLINMLDMQVFESIYNDEVRYDFILSSGIRSTNLSHKYIKREKISTKDKLIEYIIKSLENNQYCYLAINSSRIKEYINYNDISIVHCPLIIGIDKERQKIKLNDFFDFSYYSSKWIDVNEFLDAYMDIQNIINKYEISKKEKWILKIENIYIDNIKKQKVNLQSSLKKYLYSSPIKINDKNIFLFINDILNNKEPKIVINTKRVSGIKIYKYLKTYIIQLKNNNNFNVDNKAITILEKHFIVFKKIFNEESFKGYYYNSNLDIKKATQIKFLGLKIQKNRKIELYINIIQLIDELEKTERKFIKLYLSNYK